MVYATNNKNLLLDARDFTSEHIQNFLICDVCDICDI